MAAKKRSSAAKARVAKASKSLHSLTTSEPTLAAIHQFVGLEVPSGDVIDVEVFLIGDVPLWRVTLSGLTSNQTSFQAVVGSNQAHLVTSINDVPVGNYFFNCVATLKAPGAQFKMRVKSSTDLEAVDLSALPGSPLRMQMLPVRVA